MQRRAREPLGVIALRMNLGARSTSMSLAFINLALNEAWNLVEALFFFFNRWLCVWLEDRVGSAPVLTAASLTPQDGT